MVEFYNLTSHAGLTENKAAEQDKLQRKSHQSPQATNWDPDLNDQRPSANSSS